MRFGIRQRQDQPEQVQHVFERHGMDRSFTARIARLRKSDSLLEGEGFEPSVPRQKDNAFRDSSFPTCARHRRLRKRSPPRPAAASSSCRSRSDERRTHSPTRRSSGRPGRRHHPFALITALCFFRVRLISTLGHRVPRRRQRGAPPALAPFGPDRP